MAAYGNDKLKQGTGLTCACKGLIKSTYLLCTCVRAVRGDVCAGTAATTSDLAEVATGHECIIALAPASLQDQPAGQYHNC